MNPNQDWIMPDWPAPSWVRAVTTTRTGGVSQGNYASFNLAAHVDDDPAAVVENRRRLREALQLPSDPLWLSQVHGTRIVAAERSEPEVTADGALCGTPGQVCAVLTADCLPILLCDRAGTQVAAVHAGWRGLAAGVIGAAVRAMGQPGSLLLAWLGPAIGPRAFEVGAEVRDAFLALDPQAETAFAPVRDRWHADLYQLAHQQLASLGITEVSGGEWCTYEDDSRFYSYRRDQRAGRMATLIWLDPALAPDAAAV